jgi:heptosyltransferase-2
LVATDSNRCLNLTGERALAQTSAVLSSLDLLVSADTGLFHAADHLGVRALGLMGPTAFGFPTRPTSSWISLGLTCQPCSKDGRGRCTNTTYQRCLVEITPTRVIDEIRQRLM